MMKTYTLTDRLLTSIVNVLNTMPAGQVRAILNAIEIDCAVQDKQAAEGISLAVPPPAPPAVVGPVDVALPLVNGRGKSSHRRQQQEKVS